MSPHIYIYPNVYINAYITNYNPICVYIYICTVSICIQFCNWYFFAKFPTGPGLESSWYSRGLDCDRQRPQLWTSPSWVKPLSSHWSGSFAKHPRIPFAWTWVVKIKSTRMLCHYCQHCQHHYIVTLLYYYIIYCNSILLQCAKSTPSWDFSLGISSASDGSHSSCRSAALPEFQRSKRFFGLRVAELFWKARFKMIQICANIFENY